MQWHVRRGRKTLVKILNPFPFKIEFRIVSCHNKSDPFCGHIARERWDMNGSRCWRVQPASITLQQLSTRTPSPFIRTARPIFPFIFGPSFEIIHPLFRGLCDCYHVDVPQSLPLVFCFHCHALTPTANENEGTTCHFSTSNIPRTVATRPGNWLNVSLHEVWLTSTC